MAELQRIAARAGSRLFRARVLGSRAAMVPPEFAPRPVAIVTGGARRIGAAIARALAAEGWQVLIHCHRSRREADALATEIDGVVVEADLADPDAAAMIVAAAGGAAGLLVNNASIFDYDRADDFTVADWDRHMAINARAPARLLQAFAATVPKGARALSVSLLDAKLAQLNPDYFSYTTSKIAFAGVTELAARAFAPRLRVNAIAPSITLTSGPQNRAEFEAVHARNPLGVGVDTADIARALAFLIATPSITGQTITLDGGLRFEGLARDVAFAGEGM